MDKLAFFVVGVAAGIAWYRFFIVYTIGNIPHTMCDYCKFEIKRKEMYPDKK